MSRKPITIETERFVLRPVEPISFSRATFHWTQDREALAGMNWKTEGWTRWQWWRHIRRHSRKTHTSHGIWLKEDLSAPIGLHITTFDRAGCGMVGVILGNRSWWGKAVVAECRTAILDDCFGRLRAARISGFVSSRNFASIYNYQNLGFRREGIMRQYFLQADGSRTDQIVFGMLASEWAARSEKAA